MDPILIGIVGILALLTLLMFGAHIGAALGLVGVLGLTAICGLDAASWGVVNAFYYKIASYSLITIPFFVLMGFLASAGEMSTSIFATLDHWIGRIRGGAGVATTWSCTVFGTICGSSLVTASVFAKVAAPEMRRRGYEKKLAYGICAASGLIGMLIPPSVLQVVYGVLSGESIGKLLIAGVAPGIVLSVCYSLLILYLGVRRPDLIKPVAVTKVTWAQKFKDLVKIWPVLVVAICIFGGIFGGVFDPTEAGAVGTLIIFVLLMCRKRTRSWKLLWPAVAKTGSTCAMIFLILGGAGAFSQFLVMTGVPRRLGEAITGLHMPMMGLLGLIIVFYLIMGCFLDSISMLSITIPIFNPIVNSLGIDHIWYAMVVILAIEIGMLTPPVGLNVYAAKAVAEPDVTLEDVFWGILPFFFASLVGLGIILAFPGLTTILPSLMFGD